MFTLVTTHSIISNVDCATKEQRASCLPADEERAGEEVSQVTPAAPSPNPTAETLGDHDKVEPTAVSQHGPESMEVEKLQAPPSVEQDVSPELLNDDSGGTPITEPFSKEPPKFSASPASVGKTEPMDNCQGSSPCQDPQSPLSLSMDAEVLSSMERGGRLLPHSEDDEDEEYDDMRAEDDIKQELQEQEVKRELLLDDMSYMSHGDESSSGFLGSPGEQDPQLSIEFGLVPAGRSHADNLLTETDDSLPFEPFRSDREKVKRRGSPGRSRVKQVRLTFASLSCFID